ncbi:hypothetical protein [Streptomyces sp. ISL-94]|uniref:hypothetical protein n=1 Tax=Streptomyces sp. ISL-94 TaxID=2819190 RepID=UPI0020365A0E|nr:hypothetical protein [Streptomyces sp. ISL-94]
MVGQASKTHAEQQAAAATAKANEADKAAAAAKSLADKAAGDEKLAAQAAAAAAADTAAALKSVAAARASAADAAKAAEATKKADEKTKAYSAQAGQDTVLASSAARDAASEAAGANNEATEGEKSAVSARSAADSASRDATAANTAAVRSETDATAAEKAAANAEQSAKDANAAATRAEAEAAARVEAERAQWISNSPAVNAGPALSASDEELLLKECGQSCVDEWRAAMAIASQDVIDWVKANGADILLEVIGVNDLKRCLTKGDVEGCLWTLVNVASIVLVVGKLPAVSKAIARVVAGVTKFFEESAKGKRVLERYRNLIEKLKKNPEHKPGCPTVPGPTAVSAYKASASPQRALSNLDPKECNLPKGVHMPELDERAIDEIRKYHVPGGTGVDASKGLFKPEITDAQLQEIFEVGMKDAAEFTQNARGYYEKTFSRTGVGFTSAGNGAMPAQRVTLVINGWGDVVTMFPH